MCLEEKGVESTCLALVRMLWNLYFKSRCNSSTSTQTNVITENIHYFSKVRKLLFVLVGMACGCWHSVGQWVTSDYRLPRQMRLGMFFWLWKMQLVILWKSWKMKLHQGFNTDNRILFWKWTKLELNLILCRLALGALLRIYNSQNI